MYVPILKRLARMFALCLALAIASFPTTIITKEGKELKGDIEGVIVLRIVKKQSATAEKPVEQFYTTYHVLNGKELERIDEQGIHLKKNSVIVILWSFLEGEPLEDWIVFRGALRREGAMDRQWKGKKADTGQEYILARRGGRSTKPMTFSDPLAGTLERDQQMDRDIISPRLKVRIKDVVIEVPVADIIPFNKT